MSAPLPFRSVVERLRGYIRDVPDFPKPGIIFKDITPVLNDGQLLRLAITIFNDRYQRRTIDKVVAIDARGFIFGGAIAHHLGVGLSIVRKKGKLPYKCHEADYDLEYGKNTVQLHVDSIKPGEKILIIDDLLATGGTAEAAAKLVKMSGGEIVEIAFLVELTFLKGRERLKPYSTFAAITY